MDNIFLLLSYCGKNVTIVHFYVSERNKSWNGCQALWPVVQRTCCRRTKDLWPQSCRWQAPGIDPQQWLVSIYKTGLRLMTSVGWKMKRICHMSEHFWALFTCMTEHASRYFMNVYKLVDVAFDVQTRYVFNQVRNAPFKLPFLCLVIFYWQINLKW